MGIEGLSGISNAARTDDAANLGQVASGAGQLHGLGGGHGASRGAGAEGSSPGGHAYGHSAKGGSAGGGSIEGLLNSLSGGAHGPRGKGASEAPSAAKGGAAKSSAAGGPEGSGSHKSKGSGAKGAGAAPAGGAGQGQNMIAQLLQLIVQMMKSGQLKPEEAIKLLEGLAQMVGGAGGGGSGEGAQPLPSEAAA